MELFVRIGFWKGGVKYFEFSAEMLGGLIQSHDHPFLSHAKLVENLWLGIPGEC